MRKPSFCKKTLVAVTLSMVLGAFFTAQAYPAKNAYKDKSLLARNTTTPILHIQTWVSKAGVPVYWVPVKSLPMVDVSLMWGVGSSRDGEKAGLSYLTTRTLMTGAGKLSMEEFVSKLDSTGAIYGGSSNKDTTVLSFRSLTKKPVLDSVVSTMETALAKPHFPQKHFDRIKKEIQQAIKEDKQYPSAIASQSFAKLLFHNTPYAHPVKGSLSSVEKLTRDDVKAFYTRYYNRKNAQLVIVGALKRAQAEALANRLTNALPAGQDIPPLPAIQKTTTPKAQTQFIAFPASQSTIYMGQLSHIGYQDADYPAAIVGNHILGAAPLVSRLFLSVRDKKGLVYHVGSGFSFLKQGAAFAITLQTRTSQREQAIQQVHATLKKFLKEGPTQEELQRAKKNITGRFIVSLSSNAAIADRVLFLAKYHLPLNYFDTYLARINALTTKAIKEAMQKHLQPQYFTTTMVGQTPEK